MIVSLNEIEGTVLKAVRGAGLSWGLAEEAAQAARWLASRGIPWERELVRVLSTDDAALASPVLADATIAPAESSRKLSPILAGAAVADLLGCNPALTVQDVIEPVWLLPFAYRHTGNGTVVLRWADKTLLMARSAPVMRAAAAGLQADQPDRIIVTRGDDLSSVSSQPADALFENTVHDAAWRRLEGLAARTYVPASAQSRLAGAGAGLSDND